MSDTLYLFGYGSLVFSPEFPDAVRGARPAVLPGYRRAFNKRSKDRGCPLDAGFRAFPELEPGFLRGDRVHTLVLGTRRTDPDDALTGLLLAYPTALRDRLLARLDRREGYYPERAAARSGYLRREVAVRTLDGGAVRAITYLSNPAPHDFSVSDSLSVTDRAKVLINATPKDGRNDSTGGRASGLMYLEGVRRELRRLDIVDRDLEVLAAAALALPGPWRRLVHPPALGRAGVE
jgi:cation transport regulator ChaC